jgi:3-deoxy-alpha-D-manno-octulosonate 8-oxidase
MAERQRVTIPEGVCGDLSDEQFHALYDATVIHEKPLTNALGSGFREILTFEKVASLFQKM